MGADFATPSDTPTELTDLQERLTHVPDDRKPTGLVEKKEAASLFATRVANKLSEAQRLEVHAWLLGLVAVRGSLRPSWIKGAEAVWITIRSPALWPLVKIFFGELKRMGWDERGWAGRLGLSGIVGAIVLGGGGAGIAALGGAIGVPLWLVLGLSGAGLGSVIDAFKKK